MTFLFKYTYANGEKTEALFNEEKTVDKMAKLCENEDSIRSEVTELKDEVAWLEATNAENANGDALVKTYGLLKNAYKRLAEVSTAITATAKADWAVGEIK